MLCKSTVLIHRNFAINRIPDKLANKETKDIRFELSKTKMRWQIFIPVYQTEMYKKKQARTKIMKIRGTDMAKEEELPYSVG